MKKRLTSLLGAVALGATAILPTYAGTNWLKIVNYSDAQATKNNFISYGQGELAPNHTDDVRSLSIRDSTSNTNNLIVDPNQNTSFVSNLAIPPNPYVTNGSINALRLKFYDGAGVGTSGASTFPQNLLITAQILTNGVVYTGFDVLSATKLPNGQVNLPKIKTNGSNPYATLRVNFTPKESSIPTIESFVMNPDQSNATVTVNNVLPGESVVLESADSLTNVPSWSPVSTNYVSVTPANFGTTDSTTFSNVPAMRKEKEFFRARVQ